MQVQSVNCFTVNFAYATPTHASDPSSSQVIKRLIALDKINKCAALISLHATEEINEFHLYEDYTTSDI